VATNKEQEKRAEGEAAIQASIEAMNGLDKEIGQKLHPIISENAPNLMPKTWYGMPAYANKEGKIVCFFRPAQRFNDRFLTLGFNDIANLDDGDMWPLSYAVKELTPAVEQQIAELIKRAASE
jgi:hypothetical protein